MKRDYFCLQSIQYLRELHFLLDLLFQFIHWLLKRMSFFLSESKCIWNYCPGKRGSACIRDPLHLPGTTDLSCGMQIPSQVCRQMPKAHGGRAQQCAPALCPPPFCLHMQQQPEWAFVIWLWTGPVYTLLLTFCLCGQIPFSDTEKPG